MNRRRFAALSLPEGTTILDVYADDANREYIEKMSADYSVRIAELTDAEEDEPTVSPEDCDHNSNANEWQPVLGQLKETTECSKCGAII